jgi:hypothetical protein
LALVELRDDLQAVLGGNALARLALVVDAGVVTPFVNR